MQRILHQAGGHDEVQQQLILSLPYVTELVVVFIDFIDQMRTGEKPMAASFEALVKRDAQGREEIIIINVIEGMPELVSYLEKNRSHNIKFHETRKN